MVDISQIVGADIIVFSTETNAAELWMRKEVRSSQGQLQRSDRSRSASVIRQGSDDFIDRLIGKSSCQN